MRKNKKNIEIREKDKRKTYEGVRKQALRLRQIHSGNALS
jgi:hypothetical protein